MATASGPFSTYPSILSLRGVCYQISTNIAANTSMLRIDLYVDCTGSASTAGGNFSVSIAGNSKGFSWGYTSVGAGATYVGTHDVNVGHASNGSLSTSFGLSASFTGDTNWGSASASGGISSPSEITDFDFTAGQPGTMTAAAVTGVSGRIDSSWGASTSYITPVTYYHSYRSSTDGGVSYGSWSGESTTTATSASYTSLTPGLTYQFRVRAYNGQDNYSAYRESNTVFLVAGGKRYFGPNPVTDWALTAAQAKRWTGSAWVSLGTLKRWDGTNWVSLS